MCSNGFFKDLTYSQVLLKDFAETEKVHVSVTLA